MPTAKLQATFTQTAIDAANGVINGVKVMELGMLATFAGEDGKAKSVLITEAHINALLAHAGNRSIPSHWSHDWFDKGTDPIHERVGALSGFRKDDTGSLVAVLHLSPGKYRDEALWNAEKSPANMMLSAVFNYGKKDSKYLPLDFQACDLVAKGAATKALFSHTEPETMELKDFIALLTAGLADKEHGPTLKTALLSAVSTDTPDKELQMLEEAAGVTDADRMTEDAQEPALMRAKLSIGRAISRQRKSLGDSVEALLSKAKDGLKDDLKAIAKAEAAAVIGNTQFLNHATGNQGQDATAKFNAAVKDLTDKGVKQEAAIFAVIDKQPELYAATQTAYFKAPVRL